MILAGGKPEITHGVTFVVLVGMRSRPGPAVCRPVGWHLAQVRRQPQVGQRSALWDTQPMLESKNVNGVVSQANASFDLTYTSIK